MAMLQECSKNIEKIELKPLCKIQNNHKVVDQISPIKQS